MKKQTTGRPKIQHQRRQAEYWSNDTRRSRSNQSTQPIYNNNQLSLNRNRLMNNSLSNRIKRDFRNDIRPDKIKNRLQPRLIMNNGSGHDFNRQFNFQSQINVNFKFKMT